MIDELDGQIIHALQLSPRASFRLIADTVGAQEQTVARRYRRLRRDGALRVVGLLNPRVHGDAQWVVRVHAKPDDIPRLAEVLVRRPEVTHANILSGWSELVCVVRAPLAEGSDGLLQRLPRTTSVINLDIDLVLHTFGEAGTEPWTAYGHTLDVEQTSRILQRSVQSPPTTGPAGPTEEDQALFDALFADGRAPHARLADHTGWSTARVARRLTALEAAGTLIYDVDILPQRLGFAVNAMIWLTTSPTHLESVGRQIAAHAEIASVAAVSGRNNLMAIAICRDVEHLYRYLAGKFAAVAHVQTYDLSIRAQRLKQTASLISHGRLINAPS
ncbi:MAG: Lrp/AsnC family transcriptional regulator [Mycobacterium sp.]